MVRNMRVAEELGYLHVPPSLIVESKDVESLGDNVVLVCTGSQGEPLAALSRMAYGDHNIKVGYGDTVILASSLIPGNENAVYRVINELTRRGAKVVHKSNALVDMSCQSMASGDICVPMVRLQNHREFEVRTSYLPKMASL